MTLTEKIPSFKGKTDADSITDRRLWNICAKDGRSETSTSGNCGKSFAKRSTSSLSVATKPISRLTNKLVTFSNISQCQQRDLKVTSSTISRTCFRTLAIEVNLRWQTIQLACLLRNLFRLCPPPPCLVSAYYLHPPPNAHAIF